MLEKHNFNEVFVFSSVNHEKVKKAFGERYQRDSFRVKFINDSECHTFSSILRSIYSRKIISEDFLLIQAHLISDANLTELKEKFLQITENQKGVLMVETFLKDKVFGEETNLVVWD